MSSSCPPQLQLTLQPNTTSFKRSFQQFGFDFPSPVEGSDGGQNDGNDRNKRARSETSFSDSTDSSESSMVASASSSSLSPPSTGSIRTAGLSSDTSFGPPRLPTPDIEDIQMPDYPNDERSSDLSFSSQNEARYRLSLGSFNSLDEDALQRSRPSSPAVVRLSTPPPVLPPLTISEGPPRLSIPPTTVSFMETRPASPLTEAFFGGENPSRPTMQSSPEEDSDLIQGFRARLSGALERLVPQSPLVPGLELDQDEQGPNHDNNPHLLQESTPLDVPPEPPTLPPIPSVSTTAEHINIDTLLGERPTSLTSTAASSTSRSSISPSLDAHTLPSPILRDLRTWMHGPESQLSVGFPNPTSHHWQLHSYDPTSPSASSTTVPYSSGQRPGEEVTRVSGNFDRPHSRPVLELSTRPSTVPQESSWERRSFELGNLSHDETAYSDNSSRQSISGISSPPDLSWVDHPPRLQFAFRRRSRLGSTISLVTENSLEARRMADHDHIVRDLHAGRPRMDDIDMDGPRSDSMETSRDDILSRLDLGQFRAPYVHLPPFPSSSLDVAPEARDEEEYRYEPESGRGPMWYYGTSGRGNYQGAERREIRSLPDSPDTEPGPHNSFTFSQYSPPHRTSSPVRPSPPVAVLPPTSSFTRVPQNHRAPVGDAYTRRPHINLTRHLALNQRREPPPLLPQPDLGHAFVTEGQDRDVEMGVTSHAPGQPRGEYHPHSEATSPSATSTYLQPRTYREENTRPYYWDSPPEFLQSPTLLGDSPPAPVSRLQRQVHIAPNPLDIPGRPRPQPADTRRVLRFALPQSEEGLNSSSTVRLPERMPPVAPTVNTDDRMENQGFSSIQSSHRTPEPRYLSGPPIVENVDRRRDTLPAYSPTTLDPAAFAPGPFRNTIHHSFFPRMDRPTPPTIPPLPFQEPPPNSHFQNSNTVPIPSPEETFPPRGPFSRDEPAEFNYSVRVRRPPQNTEQRLPRPPFAPPRAFTLHRNNDDDNSTGNRRRMPLHNSTQEARLEASRLADLLTLGPSNSPSTYGTHSVPPRSDSTRSVERQQFINFLHRHSESERRRGSGDSTHTEGPQANDARPASNLPPRRFGAVDLEHWRTRARGRFRITPEFLTAARIRPGNMGDFIHDDDFDDSYENLVNLAVTIGDVKPKSTPADVLENLEKGIYKEWKSADGDKRCPICLDDYTDHDNLLKLNNCDHWFHQDCLKQWLHTANTCPVCRNTVHNSEPLPTSPRRPGRRFGFWRGGPPPPPGGGAGEEGSSNRPRNNGNFGASNRWASPLRRRFD